MNFNLDGEFKKTEKMIQTYRRGQEKDNSSIRLRPRYTVILPVNNTLES